MSFIFIIYILGTTPAPPTGAPQVPLFNPRHIQLGKKDALPPEEAKSSSDHGGNPCRKAANGKD